jgi:phosphosulfolactate phosphohydrolase-like enzyme
LNGSREIPTQSVLDGAKRATGTAAIIDAFRGFATAAVALAIGAIRITMIGAADEA